MNTESKPRVVVVDALRIFASFQMVQGHTIHALLDPRFARGVVYETWSYLRGLTSVAFLFAAGLAFYLTTLTDVRAHLTKPGATRARFARALVLLVLGYALHLPQPWAAVDILQCIGVSLAALELATLLLRGRLPVVLFAATVALVVIALAPLAARMQPDAAEAWWAGYVTLNAGAVFSWVPWGAYMFAGVAVGALAFPQGMATPRMRSVMVFAALATTLLVAARVLRDRAADTPTMAPSFLMTKLALVCLVATVLAFGTLTVPRLPRLLEVLAGETLVIYVFHVLLLYGAVVGLQFVVGPVLGPYAASLAALTLCALSVAVGIAAYSWKAKRRAKNAPVATG